MAGTTSPSKTAMTALSLVPPRSLPEALRFTARRPVSRFWHSKPHFPLTAQLPSALRPRVGLYASPSALLKAAVDCNGRLGPKTRGV